MISTFFSTKCSTIYMQPYKNQHNQNFMKNTLDIDIQPISMQPSIELVKQNKPNPFNSQDNFNQQELENFLNSKNVIHNNNQVNPNLILTTSTNVTHNNSKTNTSDQYLSDNSNSSTDKNATKNINEIDNQLNKLATQVNDLNSFLSTHQNANLKKSQEQTSQTAHFNVKSSMSQDSILDGENFNKIENQDPRFITLTEAAQRMKNMQILSLLNNDKENKPKEETSIFDEIPQNKTQNKETVAETKITNQNNAETVEQTKKTKQYQIQSFNNLDSTPSPKNNTYFPLKTMNYLDEKQLNESMALSEQMSVSSFNTTSHVVFYALSNLIEKNAETQKIVKHISNINCAKFVLLKFLQLTDSNSSTLIQLLSLMDAPNFNKYFNNENVQQTILDICYKCCKKNNQEYQQFIKPIGKKAFLTEEKFIECVSINKAKYPELFEYVNQSETTQQEYKFFLKNAMQSKTAVFALCFLMLGLTITIFVISKSNKKPPKQE